MSNPPKQTEHKTCVNYSIWSLNGQPIPDKVFKRLDGAIAAITKDVEGRVRLAHSVTKE